MSRLRRELTTVAVVASLAAVVCAADAALEPPSASAASLAGSLLGPVTGGLSSLNPVSAGAGALAGIGLTAVGAWVLGGATAALGETAHVIGETTSPQLRSTWFSSTYWRVAGLAALLTLPFLFAAAAQALLRSDLTLLARAAFGYLPLALLGVSLAAPLTMLLLAATDQMCVVISGVGAGGGTTFLHRTGEQLAGLGALDGSPFLAFVVGLFTLAVAIGLAIEMLVREAAVYVVLLMLPLAFSALVWPARRIWAIRMVELLIALVLSKFVIVAVLTLAGAAFGGAGLPSATRLLTAMALLMLSAFAPWVMLRLLPFTELAAGAAGALRAELPRLRSIPQNLTSSADGAAAWAESLPMRMRHQARSTGGTEARSGIARDAGVPLGMARGGRADSSAPADAVRAGETAGAATGPVTAGGAAADTPAEAAATAHVETAPVATTAAETTPVETTPGAMTPGQTSARERIPGMGHIWQAENGAWPPMTLGPEGSGGPADFEPPHEPPVPPSQDEPEGLL